MGKLDLKEFACSDQTAGPVLVIEWAVQQHQQQTQAATL